MRLSFRTPSRTSWSRATLLLVTLLLMLGAAPVSLLGVREVAAAGTSHVAPTGSDTTGTGSSSRPWRTIQRAADTVGAGDTVLVQPGTYPSAVVIELRGTAAQPIAFRADGPGVVLAAAGVARDAVLITGSSHVVWEGFRIQDAPRAGMRVSASDHVTVRGNVFAENVRWGLFTDFSDDLLIEGNTSFGADLEHGIYHSNSGDRPVIRGNVVYDNFANGIHMNGDASMGGDGVISGALVEGNLIYGNGRGGGSAINMDGVEGSAVRNNVIYDTHASGISLYQIDGGVCSRDNLIQHNTVLVASDGRWAVNVADDGCTGNRVESNILHSDHPYRGAINVVEGARPGFVSQGNVLEDRFTTDDGDSVLTFAEWQGLGYDAESVVSSPGLLFVDPAGDLHLKPGSPAIDAGRTIAGVTRDRDGNPRPQGRRSDAGAYESAGANPKPTCTLTPATARVGDQLVVSCRRLGPGEAVAVTWDGVALAGFTTDGGGAGSSTLVVPRSTSGPHSVRVRGQVSGGTNTRRVTVAPSIALSPRSGVGGATVRVTLRGFGALETVALRLRTAPGSSRTVRAGIVASATGTGSAVFTVPSGGAGAYTVEATGDAGGSATTPFTRLAPSAALLPAPTAPPSPTATATPSPSATVTPVVPLAPPPTATPSPAPIIEATIIPPAPTETASPTASPTADAVATLEPSPSETATLPSSEDPAVATAEVIPPEL